MRISFTCCFIGCFKLIRAYQSKNFAFCLERKDNCLILSFNSGSLAGAKDESAAQVVFAVFIKSRVSTDADSDGGTFTWKTSGEDGSRTTQKGFWGKIKAFFLFDLVPLSSSGSFFRRRGPGSFLKLTPGQSADTAGNKGMI